MPGFYDEIAEENSGKRIPPICSTWHEESNGVSYIPIGAVPWEEFDYKVKKRFFFICILEGPQSMPGFNSKVAKNSGKRTPCCPTTCQEESNDVSYVSIGAVS